MSRTCFTQWPRRQFAVGERALGQELGSTTCDTGSLIGGIVLRGNGKICRECACKSVKSLPVVPIHSPWLSGKTQLKNPFILMFHIVHDLVYV